MKMKIRLATLSDYQWIVRVMGRKKIPYLTSSHVKDDYNWCRLYAVVDSKDRVLATFSLVADDKYDYIAIKRLCVLNQKNRGKGIARFAIHEILKYLHNCKVGVTPWEDNYAVRHILEAEGFKMEYKFMGHWCFYSKEM
jgi:RimJ/RimL family protein N-acetyltransferase